MRYRHLGRTALRVSELCLGTMNFGPATSAADSFDILDRALGHGINFIDTANQYGGSVGVGTTETIIGDWLAQGGGRREQTEAQLSRVRAVSEAFLLGSTTSDRAKRRE